MAKTLASGECRWRTICIKRAEPLLGTKPEEMKQEEWDLKNRQALGVVRLTLSRNVAFNIEKVKTTASLFMALANMYEKPSAMNKVNKYYDLATSFYEFGWGESFHFAPRFKEESLRESIKRHEHFLALQLSLKPGQRVLDVGCGIGGPLREIARFSSTSVTGLNNNEYQISRGKELNRIAAVGKTCDFVKADFMKMPFPDNSYDAVYAIEATCHAPDAYGCYSEIYRVLKPGQCFAAYEWCMTDSFDPQNQNHQKIKAEIEIGDGLPDIRLTGQCLEALKKAGFEVIWSKDLAVDSALPWYLPLDRSHFSWSSFRLTAVGRFVTKATLKFQEYVGLAPKGSQRVHDFLEKAAEGLVEGGRKEIFTPLFFFLARKPLS